MANYWDDTRKLWIDSATGNYMKPRDQGGDGLWYSANGQSVYNEATGQWYNKASGAIVPTGSSNVATASSGGASPGSVGPSSGGTSYTPNPGYGFDVLDIENAQQTKVTNLNNQAAMDRTLATTAASKEVAELQAQHQLQIAELETASREKLQRELNALTKELEQKKIDNAQYMQAKELAQREAEYARSHALAQLKQQQDHEIQQAQVKLGQDTEARNARELAARLAANPQDWVGYEFYKRSLGGTPGQPIAGGESQGVQFPDITGPMGDANAQTLATNLFNPMQRSALYNPNLQGEGVFGTQIENPNSFTRAEAGNMSEGELGMLQGLLRAGINVNGQRVAVDAQDWFSQAQKSWVPTFKETATAPVTYR